MKLYTILAAWIVMILPATAQFNIFENLFQGQQQQQQHHHHHHQQQQQNMGSDSVWYRRNYDAATCDKYLCPHTLSCVHFPHHCPCAFPATEEKVEFGEGSMACVSKGGWAAGEAQRKIELARKGLL